MEKLEMEIETEAKRRTRSV